MSLVSRVAERAGALREFCRKEGYNTKVALFVDRRAIRVGVGLWRGTSNEMCQYSHVP